MNSGHFSRFVKHGEGLEHFHNGDTYKGIYVDGHPHGFGCYSWKDGAEYKGHFDKGLREGKGSWTNSHGDKYEGDFAKDKKTGSGHFVWVNGNVYKGEFKNDVREGEGEMSWSDGSHYKGDWKNGVPHGLGTDFPYLGTFKVNGEKARTGLYENNTLIKEIKTNNNYKQGQQPVQEPLILSVIPEKTKKYSSNKTWRSRGLKSKVTNDTSYGSRSFHR